MNIKVLAATVAGTITIFLLRYLIFGILLAPKIKKPLVRAELKASIFENCSVFGVNLGINRKKAPIGYLSSIG